MFPPEQDSWTSLEEYYLAHSRVLMGVLLVPPLASLLYNGILYHSWPFGLYLVFMAVRIVVPLALIFAMRIWIHRTGLGLLALAMLAGIFVFFE